MKVTPEIEAVARAIYETLSAAEYSDNDEKSVTWDELIENADDFPSLAKYRDLAREEAIAAIRALRGPSKVLTDAALEAFHWEGNTIDVMFDAMLDTALGENK